MVAGERNEVVDGQPESGEVPHLRADNSEDDIDPKALFHDGGPESSLGILVGEVDVAHTLEAGPLFVSQEGASEALGVLGFKIRVAFPDWRERSITPPRGGIAGGEVNIRAIILNADGEVFIDVSKDLMVRHGLESRASGRVVAMWKP